jgi:hypothetical protein
MSAGETYPKDNPPKFCQLCGTTLVVKNEKIYRYPFYDVMTGAPIKQPVESSLVCPKGTGESGHDRYIEFTSAQWMRT